MKVTGYVLQELDNKKLDVILSLRFPDDVMKEYSLDSPTFWVTYDAKGSVDNEQICDEGEPVFLELTPEEVATAYFYIKENVKLPF